MNKCIYSVWKLTIFNGTIFKIIAMGENDKQLHPEFRTVFVFSANSPNFSLFSFKVSGGDPLIEKKLTSKKPL